MLRGAAVRRMKKLPMYGYAFDFVAPTALVWHWLI